MYDKIDCKIEITSAPYFKFVKTFFKVILFIYKHWRSRVNNCVVRKVYQDDLEGKPVVEIILTLNIDGSLSDIVYTANQAATLNKMDCIQGINYEVYH